MPVLKEVGLFGRVGGAPTKWVAGCVALDELKTCSAQSADRFRPPKITSTRLRIRWVTL
jgi:hypothetical protein